MQWDYEHIGKFFQDMIFAKQIYHQSFTNYIPSVSEACQVMNQHCDVSDLDLVAFFSQVVGNRHCVVDENVFASALSFRISERSPLFVELAQMLFSSVCAHCTNRMEMISFLSSAGRLCRTCYKCRNCAMLPTVPKITYFHATVQTSCHRQFIRFSHEMCFLTASNQALPCEILISSLHSVDIWDVCKKAFPSDDDRIEYERNLLNSFQLVDGFRYRLKETTSSISRYRCAQQSDRPKLERPVKVRRRETKRVYNCKGSVIFSYLAKGGTSIAFRHESIHPPHFDIPLPTPEFRQKVRDLSGNGIMPFRMLSLITQG